MSGRVNIGFAQGFRFGSFLAETAALCLLGRLSFTASFLGHSTEPLSCFKHVIDRVVSQARVGSDIRTDEAGMPFLWIAR